MRMMVEKAASSEVRPAGQEPRAAEGRGDAAIAAETTMTAQEPEAKVATSSSRPPTSSTVAAECRPESRGPPSPAPQPTQRSTSSKFASLRAAFERTSASANGGADDVARKRVVSSSNISNDGRSREYETEISKLKDELEKERELRVTYEEKMSSLEDDIDALNDKVENQADELTKSLQKNTELEQLEAARTVDAKGAVEEDAQAREQHRDDDSVALRRQLSDLKRSISRATRPPGQLADTTLRQEIGMLQHEVQNWVVNNFRKVKTDALPAELCDRLTRIAEPEQVVHLRPLYEAFDIEARLAIYQATVAIYLMEIFSHNFLFGLHGQFDWAKRTRQAAETLPAALDTIMYNRWRAVTVSALTESAVMHKAVESAAAGMAEMVCITLNAMTGAEASEVRLASLRSIAKRAVSFAHKVRSQQAQYAFVLPSPGVAYDSTSMDDVFDDSEVEAERTVRCATFPSLYKSVDDDGANLEPHTVIFRAKVLCDPFEKG